MVLAGAKDILFAKPPALLVPDSVLLL